MSLDNNNSNNKDDSTSPNKAAPQNQRGKSERERTTNSVSNLHRISWKSIIVMLGLTVLYTMIGIAFVPNDVSTLAIAIPYLAMIALYMVFSIVPQIRKQKKMRKRKGMPLGVLTAKYSTGFWGSLVLFFIVSWRLHVPVQSSILLNKLFGHPKSQPPGDLETVIFVCLNTLVPMFLLILIFYRLQIHEKKTKERKTML